MAKRRYDIENEAVKHLIEDELWIDGKRLTEIVDKVHEVFPRTQRITIIYAITRVLRERQKWHTESELNDLALEYLRKNGKDE